VNFNCSFRQVGEHDEFSISRDSCVDSPGQFVPPKRRRFIVLVDYELPRAEWLRESSIVVVGSITLCSEGCVGAAVRFGRLFLAGRPGSWNRKRSARRATRLCATTFRTGGSTWS
jgi:hypothetical protein